MPRVITVNPINQTQGHCWPATIPQLGSPNVFIGNFQAVRVGDQYIPHVPGCTTPPTSHPVIPIQGSNNVFINGLSLVRDGDPMGCGDVANGGDHTVFANGGGSEQGDDVDNTIGFTRSIPEAEYPGTIINIPYWVFVQGGTGNELFGGGCDFAFIPTDFYTPLTEDNGSVYRNRPGPPLTSRSGAQLPPYANPDNSLPIAITISKSGDLPNNVNFYSDGSIRGKIFASSDIETFQNSKITIRISNYVGSKNIVFTLNFQKNYSQCP